MSEKFITSDQHRSTAEAASAKIDREVGELEAALTPLINKAQQTADANKYVHPDVTAKGSGLYKVSFDDDGHILSASPVTKEDIVALGLPSEDTDTDTTYDPATESEDGLMSAGDKAKMNDTNVGFGTCSTAAATAAKIITITGNDNWELKPGSIIVVKFTETNTAENPTFNVNGTGAKSVWYSAALITTGSLSYAGYANRPSMYMYDGTQYVFLGWSYDANTTYTNVKLGQGYATCATDAATVAKVGTLSSYTLVTGGIVAVKFTYDVPASATLNINSKGAKAIYHRGAAIKAGVIKAGDTATFIYSSRYHLISIDRDDDTVYTHPSHTARESGFYKITVNALGHVTEVTKVTKEDITALGIPSENTVYTHPNSGATAGTYRSVTVDAQGHVTAGSNPTTLAGYGITDAAAKSHNQAASTITAGTLAGQVVANSSGQTPGTSLLRNSKLVASETTPTVNGEICWMYE